MVCNAECATASSVSDNLGILIGGGEWRSGHGETATLAHPAIPPPMLPYTRMHDFCERKQMNSKDRMALHTLKISRAARSQ